MSKINYINGLKQIHNSKDLEKFNNVEHYVILLYSTTSYYVEGDERSRTNPGHGYPAHYETTQHIHQYVTSNEEILNQAILDLVEEKADFKFFKVSKYGSFNLKTDVSTNL